MAKRRVACPHCGRMFQQLDDHRCPEKPETIAWLLEHLPDPARPGYIVSSHQYGAISNAPVQISALLSAFGTWSGVARRFGLECDSKRGRRFAGGRKRLTVLPPDVLLELHRLADELHDGAFGPSYNEYNTYAETELRANVIRKRFGGSWGAVLSAANLQAGTISQYKRSANERRNMSEHKWTSSSNLDRGDEPISRDFAGLPVMPVPRLLPSGGLAWLVR